MTCRPGTPRPTSRNGGANAASSPAAVPACRRSRSSCRRPRNRLPVHRAEPVTDRYPCCPMPSPPMTTVSRSRSSYEKRYAHLAGHEFEIPLTVRHIPVAAYAYVDPPSAPAPSSRPRADQACLDQKVTAAGEDLAPLYEERARTLPCPTRPGEESAFAASLPAGCVTVRLDTPKRSTCRRNAPAWRRSSRRRARRPAGRRGAMARQLRSVHTWTTRRGSASVHAHGTEQVGHQDPRPPARLSSDASG